MPLTDSPPHSVDHHTTVPALIPRLGLWTLLAASLFVLAPMVRPGLVHTRSGFLAAFNVVANTALAQIGVAPDVWRSDGIAAFVPAQPLLLLGSAPAMAVQLVMVGSLLLGALGVYVWLQGRMGDRPAALAGLIYLFLPVTLSVVYLQGSMGGAVALALIPLALAGMATYARQRSLVAAAVTALAILWLWRTQAGLALAASLVLMLYALMVEGKRGTLILVVGSAVAGALSLIPIWGIRAGGASDFVTQMGTLYGLLRATPLASEPVQIGVVAFALSAASLWGVWTSELLSVSMLRRMITFCALTALVCLLLGMSTLAPIWTASGLDRLIAAPWVLAVTGAPFLAAAAGGVIASFPGLRAVPYWSSLAVLIVLSAQPWLQPQMTNVTPPRAPVSILGNNQIAILDTLVTSNNRTGETQLDVTWQVLAPQPTDYNIFVQAMAGNGADPEKVAQLDAPPLAERPATTWQVGEILSATYTIQLPVDAPADAYWYGWYNWQDGTRLPVDMGIDDKLVLYGE